MGGFCERGRGVRRHGGAGARRTMPPNGDDQDVSPHRRGAGRGGAGRRCVGGARRPVRCGREHAALPARAYAARDGDAPVGAPARPRHSPAAAGRRAARDARRRLLSREVRAMPRRTGRGAGRHRQEHAAAARPAGRCTAALACARALLGHEERHPHERHAGLGVPAVRRRPVGAGGVPAAPARHDAPTVRAASAGGRGDVVARRLTRPDVCTGAARQ
ncbi:hypothetical protein D3C86_1375350 [compost metagenome]